MFKDLFVTGTDTGIGKTVVSCALLSHLKQRGRTVQGMKPVASGCDLTDDGLRNEDAQFLIKYSSLNLPYVDVNPYAYQEAVAPHLLIEREGKPLDFGLIEGRYRAIAKQCDHTIVEGVGGWMVPLGTDATVADLARAMGLPVLLVVGMRLGCINHALLTYRTILDSGLSCYGWVANQIDPHMLRFEDNIDAIRARIDVPLLGVLPYSQPLDIVELGGHLMIE